MKKAMNLRRYLKNEKINDNLKFIEYVVNMKLKKNFINLQKIKKFEINGDVVNIKEDI